jgi:hypothetical protein
MAMVERFSQRLVALECRDCGRRDERFPVWGGQLPDDMNAKASVIADGQDGRRTVLGRR